MKYGDYVAAYKQETERMQRENYQAFVEALMAMEDEPFSQEQFDEWMCGDAGLVAEELTKRGWTGV